MATLRPALESSFDSPEKPATELLDDINKIRIMRISLGDGHACEGRRYSSYPESHHIEEEERAL